jgi:hypothetical protein
VAAQRHDHRRVQTSAVTNADAFVLIFGAVLIIIVAVLVLT